jgi:hypothetical protein
MKALLIAAVAVAVSTTAFAKDLKGTVMTDSEMDKVTAGIIAVECAVDAALGGAGVCTALVNQDHPLAAIPHLTPTPSGVQPGAGKGITVPSTPH